VNIKQLTNNKKKYILKIWQRDLNLGGKIDTQTEWMEKIILDGKGESILNPLLGIEEYGFLVARDTGNI